MSSTRERALLRLLQGGNHARGPFLERSWRGARFGTVCANVVRTRDGTPLFPPYAIKTVDGIALAFIGAVTAGAPAIVSPSGRAGLRFLDEAESINAQVRALRARQVRAIIVLIHEGGRQKPYSGPTDPRAAAPDGAIARIVSRLDDEVDLVISGHTHAFTNALLPNARRRPVLVTQAFSAGTAYARIELTLDRASGDVVERSATIATTWADEGPGTTPDPAAAELIARAEAAVAPRVNVVVGTSASDVSNERSPAGESALGDLVADAHRAALGTELAFVNAGGLRAELRAGPVRWGDLFAIEPFGNVLVRVELTGRQVLQVLERQWADPARPHFLQVSGLSYAWDVSRPHGRRVVDVRCGGAPLEPDRRYSVALSDYLASGVEQFAGLETKPLARGPLDVDAFAAYLRALPQPFSAPPVQRIARRAAQPAGASDSR
ncbi:MAG TPA: 5'-nucleotidase C-terminal domain-containing protein [Candidatus Polarisedimenticolaceae bacterium]|nr:5'-nucleotidase C-terminal domain-containing protein [Candidatus Polarisedimenticolaceae bacterium]